MNQRRPGANSGMFSVLEGASHRIKNPKSRFLRRRHPVDGIGEIERRSDRRSLPPLNANSMIARELARKK
jgi:hypothetical protein